jgi:hypothetical protein
MFMYLFAVHGLVLPIVSKDCMILIKNCKGFGRKRSWSEMPSRKLIGNFKETPKSGYEMSGLGFKPSTSRIQVLDCCRSTNLLSMINFR